MDSHDVAMASISNVRDRIAISFFFMIVFFCFVGVLFSAAKLLLTSFAKRCFKIFY